MRSILIAILMLAGLGYFICALAALFGSTQRARAQDYSTQGAIHATGNYGKAYQRGLDSGAEPIGDLYAFCDSTWAAPCDERALMLKDVCEDTIRTYTDGSKRFSCAPVNAATRDAYLATVDRDVRENTFRAWREGR